MTPDQIRQQIELKVVELLKKLLKAGMITEERSREVSKWVLQTLKPSMSLEELFKAIAKLDDSFPELSAITLPYLREYEEKITQKSKEKVEDFIRHGQYDAAIKLAKDTVNQDVKLQWQAEAKPPKT